MDPGPGAAAQPLYVAEKDNQLVLLDVSLHLRRAAHATSRTETGWADLGQFHSRPATSDERQRA